MTGIDPVVFGLFHKGLKGNPVLKEFVRIMDHEITTN